MDVQTMLFHFLGGLGLFLYGIKSMSDGLQAVAGDRLRVILEKGTKTPLRGVLTGLIVTGLIQSSSGTTVLTVGLVNAGLLNLRQAIGIIMGANIGTTVTAYLIGIKLEDYALPIIAVGVLILFFIKNKRLTYFGQVLLGFGLLFYGMSIMGDGLGPLKESAYFIGLMSNVDNNPLLGVLIGTVFTCIVQSSSATIGVLQELANQGVVTYQQAVPILFGDNIGTTITALLAGIGASVSARRAAATHFLFNFIGTFIFLPLTILGIFPLMVEQFTNFIAFLIPGGGGWETLAIKMKIAQTHGLFNMTNTLMQLPFVGVLAAIVTKLIPEKDEVVVDANAQYLDRRFFGNPSVALANASREVMHMGKVAGQAVDNAMNYFFKRQSANRQYVIQMESATDRLENQITEYVLKATSGTNLTKEQSDQRYRVLQVIGDMERVGDHSVNLIELTDYALENKVKFSEEAQKDLMEMFANVQDIYQASLDALQKNDVELAKKVLEYDDVIDEMEAKLRDGHIHRLNEGTCNGSYGAVFLNIISNLERIGDHSVNIAKYAMAEPKHKLT
ncbi:phosphate:Na+ symporter [Desulfitobacterium sp. LBE]|uniref:Na/Pi-cotransporter II-related protein n=4 Tax=Desulfitobacterium TaxID=36853 RepID=A0A098AX76_DESHA|nr:Na/Pi cotransporter family protein [Desulfitobacterium hafniense]ACL18241.1 Na/Pi-cotransporter II-related protein [Desulfitobacterium hafniense DCB-2]EHL08661.1 Na/Pi-cotransporter II-like protein [Desulfitobacterium hafniense DP7]TWH58841.1 phosphate:Na+ symporter [Desulfitobacterium sp. LBE]CDX00211.1 Na/Pi-cotransporter II-related protein [Desulfitobacterium hafniense]